MSSFWILLDLRMTEVVMTTADVKSQIVTRNKNQYPVFHRPDALPVAQPTALEALRNALYKFKTYLLTYLLSKH